MPETKTVLTDSQVESINAARRVLNDLVPDLDAAEQCGIDCKRHRDEKNRIMQGLDNIVAHFGRKS